MSPSFSVHYQGHVCWTCVKIGCYLFVLFAIAASLSYFDNFAFRKFAVRFLSNSVSFLSHHVGYVVRLRPEKEMGRVNALRVIAPMQNAEGAILNTVSHLERHPVRKNHPSLLRIPDPSVAVFVCGPNPRYASSWRLSADVIKEPFLDAYGCGFIGASY